MPAIARAEEQLLDDIAAQAGLEPIVSAIFAKLKLEPGAASKRRVLAVLAYLRRE
jgi:hypothetical protein